MTLSIKSLFSKANGHFRGDWDDINQNYDEWASKQEPESIPPQKHILDMNKQEVMEYAQDMHGLKFRQDMTTANMVKKLYENLHGVEKTHRPRKDKLEE